MAVKLWVASGAGNASTAGNWFPSGAPGALDTARFAINSQNCNWDIASVNAIGIEATYGGEITFATNVSISSFLLLEAENCITAGSAKSLTFTGTAFYNTNQTYVKNNCTDPFVNAAGRANLEYIFTGNGSTPVLLDTGRYPHVKYNGSEFRAKYVSNTLNTNANKISMQSFTYQTNAAVSHETPAQNDRDLRWEIDGQFNASADGSFNIPYTNNVESFDGGYGTWDFQAGTGRFPTSSSSSHGNFNTVGLRFTWRNVELSNRAGATNPKTTLQGTLYLDNLTVNSGIWFGNRPSAGATLLTINRPKIRGTLGLKQVADGMYISGTPNLDVAYGGTGLNMVIQGRIPYGDDDESMATSASFNFSNSILSAGNGITLNPIASQPSVSNTLWLNSGASNALYLDGSAVGGGGGGGGMTSWSIGSTTGTNQTVSNGEVVDIVGGTGISGAIGGTRTVTLDLDDTAVTAGTYGSATQSPVIAIDDQGRITSASNANIPDQKVKINALDSAAGFLENKIIAGTGLNASLAVVAPHGTQLSLNNESLAFKTIAVAGQTDVVANLLADTLTLAAGSNMTITTNASTDTITFASSGGGGGGATAFTGLTDTPANYTGSATKAATVNLLENALEFTTINQMADIRDESISLGIPTKIDFVGAGVTASYAGTTATITIPGGGGGGATGAPLFRHDEAPSANNFSPFRLLATGDLIELGLSTGSGKNVSVFTPLTNESTPVAIGINAIGAVGTNTGREYIFYGQGSRARDAAAYSTAPLSTTGSYPTYFVESMRDVPVGSGIFFGNANMVVFSADGVNNVRVIDAGEHSVMNGSQVGGHPNGEPENPSTVRILLLVDYQLLNDGRGRFNPNYRLTPS